MRIALFLWVLGLALPAWAECGTAGDDACFTDCRSTEYAPFTIASVKDVLCYEFDENASASTDDSSAISVTADSALFDFDPDRTTTGAPASGAEIYIRRCAGGWPGSCDENLCAPLAAKTTGDPMDGAEGNAADQNKMLRVGPGIYCIDIVTAPPGAGDDPIVEIRGE